MAEFPVMPLWTDSYIADTQHLTNEEHGVYLRLLMFAWRSPNGALPAEDKRLAIMVGMTPKKWAKVKPTIMQFFSQRDGKITQKRLTKELRAVRQKREQNVAAGKASAEARALLNKECGSTDVTTDVPTGGATECQPPYPSSYPSPSPSKKEHPARDVANAKPRPNARGLTNETWAAYASAYFDCYGTQPVRNASVNGMMAKIIRKLGADEAPQVAAFFITHPNRWYIEKGHSVQCLLNDAEKLRTEWATGRKVTSTGARQADRSSSNAENAKEAIRMSRPLTPRKAITDG